jgi:hypothetical protein
VCRGESSTLPTACYASWPSSASCTACDDQPRRHSPANDSVTASPTPEHPGQHRRQPRSTRPAPRPAGSRPGLTLNPKSIATSREAAPAERPAGLTGSGVRPRPSANSARSRPDNPGHDAGRRVSASLVRSSSSARRRCYRSPVSIPPSTSAAARSLTGKAWPYRSSMVATLDHPPRCATTFGSTPPPRSWVAMKCLRS